MKRKHGLILGLLLLLALFLAWRFLRPMNIFEVGDRFALPMKAELPPGLTSLSAKECGSCHPEIYQEWAQSMHAQAWTDSYYQVDLAFDGNQQICLNCHIPLANQQANLVLGFRDAERFDPILQPNPNFDPALQQEGVTCVVCHLREGQIIGPKGSTLAPHGAKAQPEMRQGITACQQCHVVANRRWDVFYRIPPCGTVAEIEQGGQELDCVGCHMPPAERPLVTGGSPTQVGRHLFRGGHHPPTVKESLQVELRQQAHDNEIRVEAVLTNIKAAHAMPTGTPDRHLTLTLQLTNAQGALGPAESWKLKRWILWRPFIADLRDTRLIYQQPRSFVFSVDSSQRKTYDQLQVTVTYHLLDEARRSRIGYQNQEPIFYPIYQNTLSLQALP